MMNLLLDRVSFLFHFQQNQCHHGELKGKFDFHSHVEYVGKNTGFNFISLY